MGKNLKNNEKLRMYRRKRNLFLFFLILPLVILIPLFFILMYAVKVNFDLLITIYFVLAIIYFVLIIFLRGKVQLYAMNYSYLLMIETKKQPQSIDRKIFTRNWLYDLSDMGYILAKNTAKFQIYYQYFKKDSKLDIKQTLIIIILAKRPDLDFYDTEVDLEIAEIHRSLRKSKVRRQITLQFKRYDSLNKKVQNEIDQIINYRQGPNYMINITVGYDSESDLIYFLEPKKKYPNKYYYFACNYIREITKEKIIDSNEKGKQEEPKEEQGNKEN